MFLHYNVICWCPPCWTHGDELDHDVRLHQVLCQLTPDCPRLPKTLQNWQPVWLDGNDQPPRENKFIQKTHWRIFKIQSRSGQSWPDFCPWRQLLTPLPHTHTSSPLCLHVTQNFVPSWSTSCPPHPHTFCFRGFTKNNTLRCDECSLKSNEFLAGGIHTHPCPNAISPSGSVMII